MALCIDYMHVIFSLRICHHNTYNPQLLFCANIKMLLLGFISTSLMASLGFAGAIQAYYEEVSSSDGSAESMQQIYGINKVFHKCSMNETCNYVIKNVVNGTTTLFNNEDEFPQNLTYFRIWKKIYHGELFPSYNLKMLDKFNDFIKPFCYCIDLYY